MYNIYRAKQKKQENTPENPPFVIFLVGKNNFSS